MFEVAPGQYIHVEQHRHAQDHVYKIGNHETLCWNADLEFYKEFTRPDEVEAL